MKTAIGYKLFRVSKKYPGKLFPLYVNANTNIPIGEWISAEPGERLENVQITLKRNASSATAELLFHF